MKRDKEKHIYMQIDITMNLLKDVRSVRLLSLQKKELLKRVRDESFFLFHLLLLVLEKAWTHPFLSPIYLQKKQDRLSEFVWLGN